MKKILAFLLLGLILTNCQSAKDALTLKKKPASDEFLVEKKSPLVLPPDYGELPIPSENINIKDDEESQNTKVTLGADKIKIDETIKNSEPTSLEKSIIKKIK
tara:strand:+ start:301 stop:609 length:309 start_codon:yes stop_codon:yes gene_type:complete